MEDKDIVKALECCANCESCDYETTNCPLGEEMECRSLLAKYSLDLINRLQAENEVLESRIGVYETCNARKDEAIRGLETENERLTIRLRKTEHQLDDAMKMYNIIKSEAYKECIEKVKEISPLRFNVEHTEYYDKPSIDKMVLFIDDNDLDNLLKELVGEDK